MRHLWIIIDHSITVFQNETLKRVKQDLNIESIIIRSTISYEDMIGDLITIWDNEIYEIKISEICDYNLFLPSINGPSFDKKFFTFYVQITKKDLIFNRFKKDLKLALEIGWVAADYS